MQSVDGGQQNQKNSKSLKILPTINEVSFREELFKGDYSKLLNLDVRCTICSSDVMWMFLFKKEFVMHPVLEVIVCEGCSIGLESSDSNSGCIWCGKNNAEGALMKCCNCSIQFCASCIKINFGNSEFNYAKLVGNDNWFCYICDMSDTIDVVNIRARSEPLLWYPRAVCYATQEFTKNLKRFDTDPATACLGECTICTNECDRIVRLQCTHHFHEKCLIRWTEKSRSCPNCRSTYVDAKIVHS